MSQDNTDSFSFRQFSNKFDYRGPISNLYGLIIARNNLARNLEEYELKIQQARSELPQEILSLFDKELLVLTLKS